MFPMQLRPQLDSGSTTPIYRQIGEYLQNLIDIGNLQAGDRLPPTRELADQLGLNRTTISAAYSLLESSGYIKGAVGRGSFVALPTRSRPQAPDRHRLLAGPPASPVAPAPPGLINFSNSRPQEELFPVAEFRSCCAEVLQDTALQPLMQIGSPSGLEPLRSYLLQRAQEAGFATHSDGILITNGCQQALDLLRRALIRRGDKVAVEDPVYPGLRNIFLEAGAELIGIPVTGRGMDPDALRRALEAGVRTVLVTPSFQNPTGATMPEDARAALVSLVRSFGAALIENDMYSELAWSASPGPRLKSLDPNVINLGSFSKIAFPGLRVGWVIAPQPVIARLTEFKQLSDLHTDQFSQAFLHRFATSGRLAAHQRKAIAAGREKGRVLAQACRAYLQPHSCRYQIPAGGLNMWVELPDGLDAAALRGLAQQAGVDFLPGRYFAVSRPHDSGFRLSFGGLAAADIRKGVQLLGSVIARALSARSVSLGMPQAII
jgi:DNA-binding transcriptional MocR family regulator